MKLPATWFWQLGKRATNLAGTIMAKHSLEDQEHGEHSVTEGRAPSDPSSSQSFPGDPMQEPSYQKRLYKTWGSIVSEESNIMYTVVCLPCFTETWKADEGSEEEQK